MLPEVVTIRSILMSSYHSLEYVTYRIFTRKPKGSILSGAGVTYSGNLEHMSSVAKASQSPHICFIANRRRDKNIATVLTTFTKASFEENRWEWLTSPDGHTSTGASSSDSAERMALVVNAAANYCDDEVYTHVAQSIIVFALSTSLRS
jgi:hypothetical protein